MRQIHDAAGEKLGKQELAYVSRSKVHACTAVQKHNDLGVRLAAKTLQVCLLSSCENIPVNMSKIVARCIGPIFSELLAKAEIRGAMKSRDKAVNDGARDEIPI